MYHLHQHCRDIHHGTGPYKTPTPTWICPARSRPTDFMAGAAMPPAKSPWATLQVDGVVFVIDSGVVKAKEYDPATGMEALQVGPISRVQATQRAGRAGRTRPGKCFRLYTRKYFDMDMPNVTTPEIQRTCLSGTSSGCLFLQI